MTMSPFACPEKQHMISDFLRIEICGEIVILIRMKQKVCGRQNLVYN